MRIIINKGFSMIELMVVIAVIGILSAIALPAYENYTVRSKMTELILYASKCKNIIEEISFIKISTLKQGNDWGCDEGQFSLTQYVQKVDTTAFGEVRVEARNMGPVGINGKYIILTPYSNAAANSVMMPSDYLQGSPARIEAWVCKFTGAPQYTPSSCR